MEEIKFSQQLEEASIMLKKIRVWIKFRKNFKVSKLIVFILFHVTDAKYNNNNNPALYTCLYIYV